MMQTNSSLRPNILYPLFSPLSNLNGVGPQLAKTLKRLEKEKVVDLLWHLPIDIAYYPLKRSLKGCIPGENVAIIAKVTAHEVPAKKYAHPMKVVCETDDSILSITFFKGNPKIVESRLPLGERRLICGKLERYKGYWNINHPERIVPEGVAKNWEDISPVYPLTAGFFQSQAQKVIKMAIDNAPFLPEWIPNDLREGWPTWKEAILAVHAPKSSKDLDPQHSTRQRLAFDELFADQLSLGIVRRHHTLGKAIISKGDLRENILKAFGHPLTPGQTQALSEIDNDMSSPCRMVRLLQGDVGSGKTLVSLLAMANAIEAGYQTALLAPTEILASQHYQTIKILAEQVGIRVALLTSRMKKKAEVYEGLASGEIQLVIGTHALIQEAVQFQNLGFVVIDEQHRFGVEQRLNLTKKGEAVDVLVMTATPIPRTLRLTAYGDLEVSRITDKPKGRKPIVTRVMGVKHLNEVCEGLKRLIEKGEKVYWVCPLIEESETTDLAASTERYHYLKAMMGEEKVGLIHGQLSPEEKDKAMDQFKNGATQILVSTTVIEVGVDVKSANVMVIEHAERFGLSQLHQLRGRVGRGDQEAHCLLLYDYPISDVGKKRLQIMKETEDGFRISEEDLILRGGGDILGTKQSGLPSYKLADPLIYSHLLEKAYQAAKKLLKEDPKLESPQGQASRLLLYLFGQEKVIHTLNSG